MLCYERTYGAETISIWNHIGPVPTSAVTAVPVSR